MPKKDSMDDYMISDTGNWNVAAKFAELKIMMPLAKCDIYEDIAKFGYADFLEELMNYGISSDILKIKAMDRLVNELIKISKNTKFAMKKGTTKATMQNLEDRLYKIKQVLHLLYKIRNDNVKRIQEVKIIEPSFSEVLELIIEIKSLINDPLNKNHLIFTDKEEFDPQAFKDKIKHRMINQG